MTKARDLSQIPNASLGFKNRIINGAMMIDQRNNGASVTPADFAYTLDRWQARQSTSSKFSIQQSSVAPAGFTQSLLVTSLSAYSVSSSDVMTVRTQIEGFNIADFAWGTASASPVTLSFWIRSSLTGTFGGSFINNNNDRSYPFSYAISAANTWEYKTITVSGDTTGTWNTGSSRGIMISFGLGVGSTSSGTAGSWQSANLASATGTTSVVGTNGATFYITGVQLEKGSTATSFDYRPYGTELALCQRYFISYGGQNAFEQFFMGQVSSATIANFVFSFPVELRIPPSSVGFSAVADFAVNDGGVQNAVTSFTIIQSGTKTAGVTAGSTGMTTGRGARLLANNSTAARLTFSAEL